MGRAPSAVPRNELASWDLVAAVFNLEVSEGLRPGPFVTALDCRNMAKRALNKLIHALRRAGITEDEIIAYFRMRDRTVAEHTANLAALLPPPTRTRDDADPSPVTSLRAAR